MSNPKHSETPCEFKSTTWTCYSTFLDRANEVFLVACGTSYHACLAASYMFSKLAFLPTYPVYASEFVEQHGKSVNIDSTILAVSQSGETADTIAAVTCASNTCRNNPQLNQRYRLHPNPHHQSLHWHTGRSRNRRRSNKNSSLRNSPSSPSSRYTSPPNGAKYHKTRWTHSRRTWRRSPKSGHNRQEQKKNQADRKEVTQDAKVFFFLGRGISTATAFEGRLKLMEIAYIPAIAFPAGESKHGPISLIETDSQWFSYAQRWIPHNHHRKHQEMKARGASIIAVIEEGDEDIKALADDYIEVPKGIPPILSPIPCFR